MRDLDLVEPKRSYNVIHLLYKLDESWLILCNGKGIVVKHEAGGWVLTFGLENGNKREIFFTDFFEAVDYLDEYWSRRFKLNSMNH